MALNISAWAIHKPIPSLLLFAALTVVGVISFRSLPITSMPEVRVPQISVTINQAGAAPAQMETEVTKLVETAVSGLPGVDIVTSEVTGGESLTTVKFIDSVPVDRALDDVRDAVIKIRGDLPGTADEPVVQRVEEVGGPVATYVVQAPLMSPEALSWLIDDSVAQAVNDIRGVARVSREGGATREIRVELDAQRLQAFGVTAAEVSAMLSQALLDESSGRSEIGAQEQSLRVLGTVENIAGLAALDLTLPGGRHVTLGDLATVMDARAETRSVAFQNGEPVITFSVFASPGYSTPVVARQVAAVLAELDERMEDVSFRLIDTPVTEVEADFASAMDTLVEGAILAIIVVFLFLRDYRATLISALAIPLSIIPTFWVMSLLGYSLNTISLLAVTLVTGVLVDDAIVEIENIVRHIRMGKSAFRASVEAADEIGLAVVATSATIIAVFLPVAFMSGLIGQFFKQFGITVAVSVAFSLLVARLITPVLAAYFMKNEEHVEHGPGPVIRWYARLLDWCLRWRLVTVTAGVAFFAASIGLAMLLPTGLFPEEDKARSALNFELPAGVTLDSAASTLLQISDRLQARPEVASVYASLGAGGDIREGTVAVTLVHPSQREIDQRGFEREAQAELATIPDVRMSFATGMGGREFSMTLSGSDGPAVMRAAEDIETAIRAQVPALQNVQSAASVERPELRILPRQADAAALGISSSEIAGVLRIAMMGDQAQNLAKFSDGARQIDIKVLLPDSAKRDAATLENLLLRSSNGAIVPLAAVADITAGVGPARVDRQNGKRQITIEADLAPGADLGSAVSAVMALQEVESLPPGITFGSAGDAELMADVFSGFMMAMGAGLMLVLTVLILLYSDIFQPITILLSLPLSIGGAMVALYLTGYAISLPVVIGLLMLMGIVTKNAILLVDFAIEEIGRGTPRREALIEAGMKRAQPIVMTTVAMCAGMMPAALALVEGGAFRVPMAIAVIGGLITSTALSLVFVPAVFTYLDDLRRILGWVFGRFLTNRNEPTAERTPFRLVAAPADAAE